jgi:membrane protein required for colicin V production
MGIDIACYVIFAFAFYRGYQKGLIMSVFTVAAYLAGAFATMHLSFVISDYMARNFNLPGTWLPLISFALTFGITVMLIRLIGKAIEKGMNKVLPTSFNRFLGSMLYLICGIVLLTLLYDVAVSANIFKEDLIAKSFMAPHLEQFGAIIKDNIGDVVPFVKGLFHEIDQYFKEIANRVESKGV